jgi:hypothetical protein
MVVYEIDSELFARIQERNLIRQYDLLANCIEIGIQKGPEALDKYTLWALNHVAVANIAQFGGRFREEPILWEVTSHPISVKSQTLWTDFFLLFTRTGTRPAKLN